MKAQILSVTRPWLPLLTLAIAALALHAPAAVTFPVVTSATTTLYANVTDPTTLSFPPDGTLYTRRDNAGSGGMGHDDNDGRL